MRIANVSGRVSVISGDETVDVEEASGGRFPANAQSVYEQWDEFLGWADTIDGPPRPFGPDSLGAPAPAPRQVFGIGLNYADHADEGGMERPAEPPVFTKFQSSIAGPSSVVTLPSANVDWEVELVVVIGRGGAHIQASDAWSRVAGLTIGQDLSERVVQMRPPVPQFSLGKSYPGFGPTGPHLVTVDELDDPDDLELGCAVNGETMQASTTAHMIFPVSELIARLSAIVPLLPGDVIFTGTPAGVGFTRKPPRFLQPGDELVSTIAGIGTLTTRFV